MKSEGSLLSLRKSATDRYRKPDESNIQPFGHFP